MFRFTNQYCIAHILLVPILYFTAISSFAAQAELIWIESDRKVKNIRFAGYSNEEWVVREEPLYTSENPLTSLALGTDKKGRKLLVWTEKKRAKTVLMSMVSVANSSKTESDRKLEWSAPTLFSDYGRENYSASIVSDQNGVSWVFWSTTRDNYSDIVVQRFVDGSWTDPQRVHTANEVPDNTPRAMIDEKGSIIVEWNSFNLDLGDYVVKRKNYPISVDAGEEIPIKLTDSVIENEIPLPLAMSTEFPALIHFPNNQVIQSRLLNDIR